RNPCALCGAGRGRSGRRYRTWHQRVAPESGATGRSLRSIRTRARGVALRLILQRDLCNAAGDIEARTAFEAQGLEREGLLEAADEHIGADPDAHRGAAAHAAIIPGERSLADIGGRRENRPGDHAPRLIADVDAELLDLAAI